MISRFPFFKVCGLTRPDDVTACLAAGAAMTGFIFAAKSPRRISPEAALLLPRGDAYRVGVFVEQTVDEVRRIMDEAELDLAQLHGRHNAAFCQAVGPERVIKALWPEKLGSAQAVQQAMERFAESCAFFLLDAGTSGGGHGRAMDFSLVAGIESPHPWLLAGGLGPHNMDAALDAAAPQGLDLNSGLETAPGVKDHAAIARAAAIVAGRWPQGGQKNE
jgi:phosphoribosylanthranilate isomerase